VVLIAGDVMYSVEIQWLVYRNWPVYSDWCINGVGGSFMLYVRDRYPEILSMGDHIAADGGFRVFEFESEEHYHWFLLKVM